MKETSCARNFCRGALEGTHAEYATPARSVRALYMSVLYCLHFLVYAITVPVPMFTHSSRPIVLCPAHHTERGKETPFGSTFAMAVRAQFSCCALMGAREGG